MEGSQSSDDCALLPKLQGSPAHTLVSCVTEHMSAHLITWKSNPSTVSPMPLVPPAPLVSPHLHLVIQFLLQLLHFSGELTLPSQGLSRHRRRHLPETGQEGMGPHPDPGPTGLTLPPGPTRRWSLTNRGCICSSTKLTFLLTDVSLSELLEDKRAEAKAKRGKR